MIRVQDLSVQLGDFVLNDVNLTVNNSEYFVFLGPTGAGKTVLLEQRRSGSAQKGRIWLGDRNITGLPPKKRVLPGLPGTGPLSAPFCTDNIPSA
jgi:ABC-type sugar transport system ATPase subunit